MISPPRSGTSESCCTDARPQVRADRPRAPPELADQSVGESFPSDMRLTESLAVSRRGVTGAVAHDAGEALKPARWEITWRQRCPPLARASYPAFTGQSLECSGPNEEDEMKHPVDYGDMDATLDVIAAWLIAAYGPRLKRVSLSLQGYYGPISECHGIVPITLDRGVSADGTAETRETLPTREIRDHAEALLARLFPAIRCTRDPVRDVREVASSQLVTADEVSAHRKIELRRAYGPLPIERASSTSSAR